MDTSTTPSTNEQNEPPKKQPTSVRKRKLPSGTDKPKSILKPAPPPQKAFSFRRDILQSLNSRLAQQGVNVQVPLPNAATAQGAANLLGGMFKKIGGIAGAALAGQPQDQPLPSAHDPSPAAASLQSFASRTQPPNQPYNSGARASPPSADKELPPHPTPDSLTATSGLPAPSSSPAPLKRVQFTVSKMSVIYPMGTGPPADEDDTRKRIEKIHRDAIRNRKPQDWTPAQLETLYRECCRTREEQCLKKMRLVFADAAQQNPPALKTLDLSFLPLDRQAIDPIADLLSIDFGLSKLVLENCGLTDDGLKAILHALLISGTLPNLSLASNRRIRYMGWRYVSVFMRRARALKYLDLSENSINRASMEHIAHAIRKPAGQVTKLPPAENANGKKKSTGDPAADLLAAETANGPDPDARSGFYNEDDEPLMPPAPLLRSVASEEKAPLTSAIISLRLENCAIRGRLLSLLAPAVRYSDLKHLSLRRNRINQMSAVALAIMLKDYPDASAAEVEVDGLTASGTFANGGADTLGDFDGPVITSSPAGGMTARRMPMPLVADAHASNGDNTTTQPSAQKEAEAMALLRAKRAKRLLGTMPCVGSLLTLDLKSNDIRGGVNYLAQVLRKNRTLRVLNLSDNNIEMQGLVALAEALKYNSTLETLDLSHNACSGPGLEGITTLRQAFALNSNLKRLFLNDTDLSSEGAIALAEFLPEARSLIHLDLTENFEIEIAGVMALAVSVRLNKSLRCLDLNIPPNDPDFARLSQEILQSCIRNTEAAQKKASQKGLTQPVAAPIYKSVVARAAREKSERQKAIDATRRAEEEASAALANGHPAQQQHTDDAATATLTVQSHEKLLEAAETCLGVLKDLLESERSRRAEQDAKLKAGDDGLVPLEPPPGDFVRDLVAQSKRLRTKLGRAVTGMGDGGLLERALKVNDELDSVTDSLVSFYQDAVALRRRHSPSSAHSSPSNSSSQGQVPRVTLSPRAASKARAIDPEDGYQPAINGRLAMPGQGHPSTSSENLMAPVIESQLSSPSFSIGSDEEDDEEDEDASRDLALKKSAALRGIEGLRIDTSDTAGGGDGTDAGQLAVAEKEDLPPEEMPLSPRGEVEMKAREMVDEEGEIFRRAKSLEAEEESDENQEGQEGAEARKSDSSIGYAEAGGENDHQAGGGASSPSSSSSDPRDATSLRRSLSSASSSSSGSLRSSKSTPVDLSTTTTASATPHVDIADEETSGDELRKRLLAADLPRDSSPAAEKEKEETKAKET